MKKPLFSNEGTHLAMVFHRSHVYPAWPHCTDAIPFMRLAGTMHVEPMPLAKQILARHAAWARDHGAMDITHEGWDWKPNGPVRYGYIDRAAP